MTQEVEILQYLHYDPEASRPEIGSALTNATSPATLKRLIADSVTKGCIEVIGRGPATRYRLTPQASMTVEKVSLPEGDVAVVMVQPCQFTPLATKGEYGFASAHASASRVRPMKSCCSKSAPAEC